MESRTFTISKTLAQLDPLFFHHSYTDCGGYVLFCLWQQLPANGRFPLVLTWKFINVLWWPLEWTSFNLHASRENRKHQRLIENTTDHFERIEMVIANVKYEICCTSFSYITMKLSCRLICAVLLTWILAPACIRHCITLESLPLIRKCQGHTKE